MMTDDDVLAARPAVWTGLMAGFAPAPTDRTTTNSGDVGGPSLDVPVREARRYDARLDRVV